MPIASTRTNVALAALFLTAAACGGSTTNSTGTGASSSSSSGSTSSGSTSSSSSGTSIAQACADSAHASCTERDKCSSNSYLNTRNYGSEGICETREELTCNTALAASGTGQTPTAVEGCVAAYPTYTCPNFLDNNPPVACATPAGKLATGAACGANAQCVSTFCAIAQYAVCGTCQPPPTAGATCATTAECGHDLACAIPTLATTGVCAPYGALNAMCLTGVAPCASGLSCVGDVEATKTMGTCQASGAAPNAACDGSRKTMPGCNNDLGLFCIPTAKGSAVGTCQSASLAPAMMPCGDVGAAPITGIIECDSGGTCKKAAATDTMGTCQAPAADGANCDSDPLVGPPCLAPAKCVVEGDGGTAGICTVPNATKCM
jgi:hypothetical protein